MKPINPIDRISIDGRIQRQNVNTIAVKKQM